MTENVAEPIMEESVTKGQPMNTQNEKQRMPARAESGVTLIEIMIVLAIIALIMGFLIGPKVLKSFGSAKKSTAWMMAKEFEQGYTQWASNNDGDCPEKIEDLMKYTNKKDVKDPWGQKFVMKCGDAGGEAGGFGVMSYGPNKKDDGGSGDDIASWLGRPKD
jgi:prepilin-type N-terminal cleavage/methylation domain-containing protein